MMESKKLYKSRKDRKLSGVCGGLAEHFNADASIIRILAILMIVFTGFFPGVIVYIAMAVIIPEDPFIS